MARGYPDYFGIPMFPKYGNYAVQPELTVIVLPAATTTILEISGKNITKGGIIWLWGYSNEGTTFLNVWIDNIEMGKIALSTLFMMTNCVENVWQLYPTRYDTGAGHVILSIQPDVTAEISYKVELQNGGAANVNVYGRLFYSKILT